MPHGRHDYPKAIHLLRVQGRERVEIFFPAELLQHAEGSRKRAANLQIWESLLARACDRHAAKVHGYTWLPNVAILLLQRFGVPLRIILPSLLGQYSRHLHETGCVPPGESPYLGRCESIEVTPELLPYALRNLYARPVRAGLCVSPLKYPFCSCNLHFADAVPSWFENQEFLSRVRRRGHVGRSSVERFLAKPESHHHAEIFEHLSSRTPQIAGERPDIEQSNWAAEHPAPALGVEQVAQGVAVLVAKAAVRSGDVLAAALITWYATRTGTATLNQMGHWFRREPTTLRADIESHRRTSARLFDLRLEEFLALTRSDATTRGASCPGLPLDPEGVAAMPTSSAHRSNAPRAVPGPKATSQNRGGSSRPRFPPGLASVCTISKEDTDCPGRRCDPELTVGGRRGRRPS